MCGIIGVVRRPDPRPPLERTDLITRVDAALQLLEADAPLLQRISSTAEAATAVDADLRSMPGVRALVGDPDLLTFCRARFDRLAELVAATEAELDQVADSAEAEALNAAMIGLKDAAWALQRDRIRNAAAIAELVGSPFADGAVPIFFSPKFN